MSPQLHRSRRWYFVLGVMLAQTITLIVLAVISFSLRGDVAEQQRGTRLAEVATCYASARGRPKLIVILRAIGDSIDPSARDELTELTDGYEQSTPLVVDCDELARVYGMDPADFPPPTPRGEEGN